MINHNTQTEQAEPLSRPDWIRGRVSWDRGFNEVRELVRALGLNSVCVEAACPNRGECWKERHVTFMILGDVCTRGCRFCNVGGGIPDAPGPSEPRNVAEAVKKLGIKYVVITSVTRDDLQDRGAGQFLRTVREIKAIAPDVLVELLIPDLDADPGLLREIAFSPAIVIGHNIEMPHALYPSIRPKADYRRSLEALGTLSAVKAEGADILVKSSVILGLGETEEDICRTLTDLRDAGVDIVYAGQYLSPTPGHWPVKKYYAPEEFEEIREKAESMGFGAVLAGPLVRSSYRAGLVYRGVRS